MTGTVLVTGASRGIGRASALRLAAAGHDLVLWARTADELADTGRAAERFGGRVSCQLVDVTDPAQVAEACAAITWNSPPGLVLNAGCGIWQPIEQIDDQTWQRSLDTNLTGAMQILRLLLPEFRQRRSGLIVGILSDSARFPFADRAAYSAAKAGLATLLEVARREARADGVRISTLWPSRVDTSFQGSMPVAGPGSRPGSLSAEDVAAVIEWLFGLPAGMEVRELQLAALTATYGPYEETMPR
jgi:NADP-dependent 3-hydroxy acid dehydrogenase YdfG